MSRRVVASFEGPRWVEVTFPPHVDPYLAYTKAVRPAVPDWARGAVTASRRAWWISSAFLQNLSDHCAILGLEVIIQAEEAPPEFKHRVQQVGEEAPPPPPPPPPPPRDEEPKEGKRKKRRKSASDRSQPQPSVEFKTWPWSELGLASVASDEEARAAFKSMAFDRHPDRGGSLEAMKDLTEAWNEIKRIRRF